MVVAGVADVAETPKPQSSTRDGFGSPPFREVGITQQCVGKLCLGSSTNLLNLLRADSHPVSFH
jgi:hypothetical protein